MRKKKHHLDPVKIKKSRPISMQYQDSKNIQHGRNIKCVKSKHLFVHLRLAEPGIVIHKYHYQQQLIHKIEKKKVKQEKNSQVKNIVCLLVVLIVCSLPPPPPPSPLSVSSGINQHIMAIYQEKK